MKVYDYIVVGSGAGGGPLAARLAEAGEHVLLLEAGRSHMDTAYHVPAYHAHASQALDRRWDYWVRHYEDGEQQQRDSKYRSHYPSETDPCEENHGRSDEDRLVDGILYPRAAGLGGCTAHHALITLYPHDSDWQQIAEMTGDDSWSPEKMRRYFASYVERCLYRDQNDPSASGHGFSGNAVPGVRNWLSTSIPDLDLLSADDQLLRVFATAIKAFYAETDAKALISQILRHAATKKSDQKERSDPDQIVGRMIAKLDPNAADGIATGRDGLFLVPLSTQNGLRVGTREVVERAQAEFPNKLQIETGALVTRVILEDQPGAEKKRATGVEYASGDHLYAADPKYDPWHGQTAKRFVVKARKEVILCAGTFNTPQILMLSGIGPERQLNRLHIDVKVPNDGVGENLHDRYEVAVINRLDDTFKLWNDANLHPAQPDHWNDELDETGKGLYATSGATLAFVHRSDPKLTDPDLIIFGMPVYFKGYYPGYNADTLTSGYGERDPSAFTWAILKKSPTIPADARGNVTLKNADPFTRPKIHFKYFPRGADDPDARILAEAVQWIRKLSKSGLSADMFRSELQPGGDKVSEDQVRQWVRDEAWGHHACGTCRIGSDDDRKEAQQGRKPAVVDSKFRVHGVDGLRIVDASVFPDIPGFFIATPIYIIAEKAAEDILADR